MSRDCHILCVGSPDVPQSDLLEAASTAEDERRTSVDSLDTAERHLLGDVVFDCVFLDEAVEECPPSQAIDRLRACQRSIPIVVLTVDGPANLRDALDTVPDCAVVSRQGEETPNAVVQAIEAHHSCPDDASSRGLLDRRSSAGHGESGPEAAVDTLPAEPTRTRDGESTFDSDGTVASRSGDAPSDLDGSDHRLLALIEAITSFHDAETPGDVTAHIVRTAPNVLGRERIGVALYDASSGLLQPVAIGDAFDIDALEEIVSDELAWQAYVERTVHEIEDTDAVGGAIVVPMAAHGVVVVATPGDVGIDDVDVELLDALATRATAALDRADRERRLREQIDQLESERETLQQVSRLDDVVRQVLEVLRTAETRERIEADVCETVAATDVCRLAWFTRYERSDGSLVPTASTGIDIEELDPRPLADGKRVAGDETGSPQVVDVEPVRDGGPPYDPWAQTALKRGCQSRLSIPIGYRGELYGVLSLCTPGTDVEATTRAVLAELGETIGYAINGIERKEALAAERSVDLTFRTGPFGDELFDLLRASSETFALETLVQRRDGFVHTFFRVSGIETDDLESAAEASASVESLSVVTENDDGLLLECALGADSLFSTLLDRGAMVKSMSFDEETRLVVRIPQSTGVRRFTEQLQSAFDSVTLTARQERDEPIRNTWDVESSFDQQLTDRQRQVIETAYYSGFFEWPRESTGVEVAEMLDVSQPTVNRHIRRGERALFGLLFDDGVESS